MLVKLITVYMMLAVLGLMFGLLFLAFDKEE